MTPRTRKAKPEEFTSTPEKVETFNYIDDAVKKRPGRKPNPLTAVMKEFDTAKRKLATADRRAAAVGTIIEAQEAAQARYDAAKKELDAVYGDLTA